MSAEEYETVPRLVKHPASSFSDRLSAPAVCNVDETVATLPSVVAGPLASADSARRRPPVETERHTKG